MHLRQGHETDILNEGHRVTLEEQIGRPSLIQIPYETRRKYQIKYHVWA